VLNPPIAKEKISASILKNTQVPTSNNMQQRLNPTSFTRDNMKRKNLFYKGQLVVIHSHTSDWDGEVGKIVRINPRSKRISVSRGREVRTFGEKNVQDVYAWNIIQQRAYNKPHPRPTNEAQGIFDQLFGDDNDKENNSDDELFLDATNNNHGDGRAEAECRDVTTTNKEKQHSDVAELIASNKKKKEMIKELKEENRRLKRKVQNLKAVSESLCTAWKENTDKKEESSTDDDEDDSLVSEEDRE
jgi:hypothetical protein